MSSTDCPQRTPPEPPGDDAPAHPNGIDRIDHVVAFTPDMDRTVTALEAAGLDLRLRREGPTSAGSRRQAFFRVGRPILETIEHPPDAAAAADVDAPARFWGLAFGTADLDACVAALGPLIGEPRDAIQEGRRIATLRQEAGLGLPVAVMSEKAVPMRRLALPLDLLARRRARRARGGQRPPDAT